MTKDTMLLAEQVLKWWEEHKYFEDSGSGLPIYNEEPDFVVNAKKILNGYWTREPLKERGTYFYTFKKFNGEWAPPSRHFLIEDMEFPENQRRWSEKVEEWIPDSPKEGE